MTLTLPPRVLMTIHSTGNSQIDCGGCTSFLSRENITYTGTRPRCWPSLHHRSRARAVASRWIRASRHLVQSPNYSTFSCLAHNRYMLSRGSCFSPRTTSACRTIPSHDPIIRPSNHPVICGCSRVMAVPRSRKLITVTRISVSRNLCCRRMSSPSHSPSAEEHRWCNSLPIPP